jgi:hypothetical protein
MGVIVVHQPIPSLAYDTLWTIKTCRYSNMTRGTFPHFRAQSARSSPTVFSISQLNPTLQQVSIPQFQPLALQASVPLTCLKQFARCPPRASFIRHQAQRCLGLHHPRNLPTLDSTLDRHTELRRFLHSIQLLIIGKRMIFLLRMEFCSTTSHQGEGKTLHRVYIHTQKAVLQ